MRYYQPHSQIYTSHECRYTNIATLNCTKFKTKMAYLQLSKVLWYLEDIIVSKQNVQSV